jgi:hypothetical protein
MVPSIIRVEAAVAAFSLVPAHLRASKIATPSPINSIVEGSGIGVGVSGIGGGT